MLTDRLVKTLKASTRLEIPDGHVPGMSLRVTTSGVKSWSLRYRVGGGRAGRVRRLTLGTYPRMSLAKARKKAMQALRAIDDGNDPAAQKQAARLGETVGDLAKDYIAKYAKRHKRSWESDDRYLEVEVLPAWKHLKAKELTRRHVRDLIEGIAERGSPVSANRCLALVRKMLNWAVQNDWIDANPAALIPKPGAEGSRDRVLSDDEIRLVWEACEDERPAMRALMRLRLLTAQRGGELSALKWTDVEGHWLTIPATVSKNKRAHRVFLTATAKALIDPLPRVEDCEYVFPGRSGNTHCGDHKKGGQRIAARILAKLQEEDATIERFDFRGHDLRRTAATKMAEAGISQTDIAKVLNHAEGGPKATHVYNRYQYDREKQIALETWGRVLAGILEEKSAGKVLPMTKGALAHAG
jgi:integrase